jgi:hypothetical protein
MGAPSSGPYCCAIAGESALMSASKLADGEHDWVVLGADGAGVKA